VGLYILFADKKLPDVSITDHWIIDNEITALEALLGGGGFTNKNPFSYYMSSHFI
jgi:hypothetical protein